MGGALERAARLVVPDGAVASWTARATLPSDPAGGFVVAPEHEHLTASTPELSAAMDRLVVAKMGAAGDKYLALRSSGALRLDHPEQHMLYKELTLRLVGEVSEAGCLHLTAWLEPGHIETVKRIVYRGSLGYDERDVGQIKWSRRAPVPAIGADVVVSKHHRRPGKATVVGHMEEHGWIYLMAVPFERAELIAVGCLDLAGEP